jgi:hypothetical integral membrane protein (TIGR02206 family)
MLTTPSFNQLSQDPLPYNWATEFRAFSSYHLLVVLICTGIMVGCCLIGKRLLGNKPTPDSLDREARFRKLIAWSIILSQAFINIRRMVYFDLQDSLPLHMCRLGVWIAAWHLLTLDRRARSLTLFWGIGLSAQVFFTPFVKAGYTDITFWIYWLNHLQIVGVAIYDITVLGYRPNLKDLGFASVLGVLYAIITIGFNWILGTNYSYLGAGTHEGVSLVDKLGPYPQRTIWMCLGALFVFLMIYTASSVMQMIRSRFFKKHPSLFIGPLQCPDATLCQ